MITKDKAILFVSHLIPRESYNEVSKKSKKNMQDAANALQWNLVRGFAHHFDKKIDVINFLPIASFPQYYTDAGVKKMTFDAGVENPGISVGFNNVKYIRRWSIRHSLYRQIEAWCTKNSQKHCTIIAYTLNSVMLEALRRIKNKYKNVSVCAIVADLPDMINLSSNKGLVRRLADSICSSSSYKNIEIVDKFVFLTRQMSEYIGNSKPYCVMEGIAPEVAWTPDEAQQTDTKTVLYTGTLHKKFGVVHLLEAFGKIADENYRLVICGVGDSEKTIIEAAAQDPRIIFKGKCSRDQVLELQRAATVLVNPRMNNEEFTKYSFPSKNLEYLSSGVPLIAFKLDGIPDEYDGYINYVEDDTPEALADKIYSICQLPAEQRRELGRMAQVFISENKNAISQTRKIVDLLND